jgi:non-specific serine/threonine protein kinase/serine/threonine-protein kinase
VKLFNWIHHTQQFVRHYAAAVAASAGFLILAIAVAVVSIRHQSVVAALERATHERERAEKLSQFMLDAFSAGDPFADFGREPTSRILLEQAARRIQDDLSQPPEVRARLLEAIGRSYRRLDQPDRAVVYLQDSLRIQRQLPHKDDAALGSIVTEIAIALREAGRFDESDDYFSVAQEISRQVRSHSSEAHAELLVGLGQLEKIRGNPQQALAHLEQALQLMRGLRGPQDPKVSAIRAEMSSIGVSTDDPRR